jgi:hypothetical protein
VARVAVTQRMTYEKYMASTAWRSKREHQMRIDHYGWQLYETVSEGSPLSPVCATKDELAAWMSSPAAGRDRTRTRLQRPG